MESMHVRIYRKDYRPPEFLVDAVDLRFDLDPAETVVQSKMQLRRNPDLVKSAATLMLHGDELELRAVRLDGADLDSSLFEADAQGLRIRQVPERFELETEVVIHPSKNTKLTGLYTSNDVICTQCEAEGFRRITYSLDRPDVMTRFTTRIEADRANYPVLLSNGNRVLQGDLSNRRHWVQWDDPFRKPSYLFALVAGDLVCHHGTFTTASGRDVALEIWVEAENADNCEHALASLQAAMKWEEETYGLEYDLGIYMIVAVNDFNTGAMENKGLNIFNARYVLANPSTATDDDYERITGIVAHEYFHNWTGNRVTCRDWFQLTLKEGLAVFRDQEFSADMTSRAVQRINDVTRLRTAQFAEDAGPLAHPIRPESYIEVNNLYTATVYQEGAEVVRLYQTLLGREGFRKGLRHYLEKHELCAVTCDDFRQAMADANGLDFAALDRWYSQAGTPVVRAIGIWDDSDNSYTLTLSQSQHSFSAESSTLPLPIPIRMSLLDVSGKDIAGTARMLEFTATEQTYTFENVSERPIASLARDFSAPIKLEFERSREELAFLMAHDSDPFNRWDAGQTLAKRILLGLVARVLEDQPLELDEGLVQAFRKVLFDSSLDGSLKALTLSLPTEEVLAQELPVVDPYAVHTARHFAVREIATALHDELSDTYERHACGADAIDKTQIDRRRLKNLALRYLVALEEPETIAKAAAQFKTATGMSDYEAAFVSLIDVVSPETDRAIAEFYERWRGEALVLDKWFRMQAMSCSPVAFDRIIALSKHPDFTLANPNRARSLLYSFSVGNPVGFHRADGKGYRFFSDHILALDAINPQVAAIIVSSFNQWKRYEPGRSRLMKAELERIASHCGISKDVSEIVERALKR